MGIAIYNDEQEVFTDEDTQRFFVNGYTGGSSEQLVYIRNDDVSKWYTNVSLSIISNSIYDAFGELGITGISFKFIYGERRPTEAEWDVAVSGSSVQIPNIGTIDLADTSTYHPVWVRIFIPGNTPAGINDTYALRLKYLPRVVV